MSKQSIETHIATMVANNPLGPKHDTLWSDPDDFAPLQAYLASLKRQSQRAEIQATYSALCALAKNTLYGKVAPYIVDLSRWGGI